jgi:predicted MFS family arabinose efflux permease
METRELLRRPGFRALATTYGLSEVVDWLTTIALAVLVYDATGSAVATTILFICSKFVPALIAPGATARVDTIAPRRSLPALYAVQCVAFAGMAAVGSHVAPLVALAALAGTAALVSRALVRASVAAALPEQDDLRAGNALLNVIFSVAFAVGPAVAGAAVAVLGADAALVGGAALLLTMALYVRVSALPALTVSEHEAEDGWWTKLRAGISHLRSQPLISELFAAQALLLVLFTMVPPIEVVYARQELGTTAAGLGALMAAWGIGAVAGSALFARLGGRGMIAIAAIATAAMGISYLGMGLAGTLPVACLLSALGGVGNGMQWIAFVTTIQTRVPSELQARAMALVESLGSAVPGIGFVLGGAIAATASARVAYVVAGAGILGILVIAALGFRLLRASDPAPQPA